MLNDDRRRLTSATNQLEAGWSKVYSYDGAGRMTFQTGIGAFTYPSTSVIPRNGPSHINGQFVTYDGRGNMTNNFGGGNADYLPWEDKVSEANGVRYFYDADGNRNETVYTTQTHFFGSMYERNANSGAACRGATVMGKALRHGKSEDTNARAWHGPHTQKGPAEAGMDQKSMPPMPPMAIMTPYPPVAAL